jgi:hypothetical protein
VVANPPAPSEPPRQAVARSDKGGTPQGGKGA